jgi:hypothetical protein
VGQYAESEQSVQKEAEEGAGEKAEEGAGEGAEGVQPGDHKAESESNKAEQSTVDDDNYSISED